MRAMTNMQEKRSDDQCYGRSHTDGTAPGAVWLRAAEGQQLQLLEAILDRIAQLV